MAVLDFPASPTKNQEWIGPNGVTYTFDGKVWTAAGGSGGGGGGGFWSDDGTALTPTDVRFVAVQNGKGYQFGVSESLIGQDNQATVQIGSGGIYRVTIGADESVLNFSNAGLVGPGFGLARQYATLDHALQIGFDAAGVALDGMLQYTGSKFQGRVAGVWVDIPGTPVTNYWADDVTNKKLKPVTLDRGIAIASFQTIKWNADGSPSAPSISGGGGNALRLCAGLSGIEFRDQAEASVYASFDSIGHLGMGVPPPAGGERLTLLSTDGAIRLGASIASTPADGTFQWTGTKFQGRVGGAWVDIPGGTGGLPTGGTTGQSLVKLSNTNFDVGWSTVSGGGGAPTGPAGKDIAGSYPDQVTVIKSTGNFACGGQLTAFVGTEPIAWSPRTIKGRLGGAAGLDYVWISVNLTNAGVQDDVSKPSYMLLFRSDADQVSLSRTAPGGGAATVLAVDSIGRVLIGADPTGNLHVATKQYVDARAPGGASSPWKIPAAGSVSLTTTTDRVGIGTDTPAQPLHVKTPTGVNPTLRLEATDATGQPGISLYAGAGGTNQWSMFLNGSNSLQWWATTAWGGGAWRGIMSYDVGAGNFTWSRDDGTQYILGAQRDTTAPSGGPSSTAAFSLGTFYASAPFVVTGRTYRLKMSGHMNKVATSQAQLRVFCCEILCCQITLPPDPGWSSGVWILECEIFLRSTTRFDVAAWFKLVPSTTVNATTSPPALTEAQPAVTYALFSDVVVGTFTAGTIRVEGQFDESQATNHIRRWKTVIYGEQ